MAKDFMKKLMSMSGAVTERKSVHADVLDTHSPSLNFTFGKGQGLPRGYSILLFGEPKAGKTLISNSFVGRLHQNIPTAYAIKFNTEYREGGQLSEDDAKMWGIDLDRYAAYETNLPDQIFDRIERDIPPLIEDGMDLRLIIIDSLNGIQGRRALNADSIMTQQIGDNAMTIQEGLKRILPIQRKYNFSLILTSQVRSQMDMAAQMRGEKIRAAVSFATKHHCEYSMSVERIASKAGREDMLGNKLEDDSIADMADRAEATGHRIRVKMVDSSMGAKGRVGEFTINYGKGIVSTHEEVFLLGLNRGVIQKPNNLMYGFGDKSWKGKEAMINAIKQDTTLYDNILKELKMRDLTGAIPVLKEDEESA